MWVSGKTEYALYSANAVVVLVLRGGIVADAREHFLAAGRLRCYWPPLNLIKERKPGSDSEFERFPEVPTAD